MKYPEKKARMQRRRLMIKTEARVQEGSVLCQRSQPMRKAFLVFREEMRLPEYLDSNKVHGNVTKSLL